MDCNTKVLIKRRFKSTCYETSALCRSVTTGESTLHTITFYNLEDKNESLAPKIFHVVL